MFSSLRICARKAAAAAPSAGSRLRNSRAGGVGGIEQTACRALATVPGPRLFDYETVTSVLKQSDAVEAVEAAFGMLAKGKVDVPIPMHIGIDESANAGPGDCHIKGGYISGTTTWTVKLANVSFYKNLEKVCASPAVEWVPRGQPGLPDAWVYFLCASGATDMYVCKRRSVLRASASLVGCSRLTHALCPAEDRAARQAWPSSLAVVGVGAGSRASKPRQLLHS